MQELHFFDFQRRGLISLYHTLRLGGSTTTSAVDHLVKFFQVQNKPTEIDRLHVSLQPRRWRPRISLMTKESIHVLFKNRKCRAPMKLKIITYVHKCQSPLTQCIWRSSCKDIKQHSDGFSLPTKIMKFNVHCTFPFPPSSQKIPQLDTWLQCGISLLFPSEIRFEANNLIKTMFAPSFLTWGLHIIWSGNWTLQDWRPLKFLPKNAEESAGFWSAKICCHTPVSHNCLGTATRWLCNAIRTCLSMSTVAEDGKSRSLFKGKVSWMTEGLKTEGSTPGFSDSGCSSNPSGVKTPGSSCPSWFSMPKKAQKDCSAPSSMPKPPLPRSLTTTS